MRGWGWEWGVKVLLLCVCVDIYKHQKKCVTLSAATSSSSPFVGAHSLSVVLYVFVSFFRSIGFR